jgi:small subunit ribosomal protein S9
LERKVTKRTFLLYLIMEKKFYYGTGKRKTAIARVRLYESAGSNNKFIINNKSLEEYFGGRLNILKQLIEEPIKATNTLNKFDIIVNVKGGGITGQAQAIRHGIAQALLEYDEKLRPILRKGGYLTRDARVHERKKYGRYGRRRGFQWTKR